MEERPIKAFIDADFLVYRVGFASKDVSESVACSRLQTSLLEIVFIDLKCSNYDAFITGRTNFRYVVATTVPYKGNRKSDKPPHYAALRAKLVDLGASISDGQEADDDVASASTKEEGWIVHVDKDLNQLPGWHYNPVRKEKYFVTEFEGLMSFYTQLLIGDKIDNIIGLYGIGPVKAAKLLADCKTEFQLYAVVKKAYEDHEEPPERLLENGCLLWLSRYEGQRWEAPSAF